jgi:hypothetical protein
MDAGEAVEHAFAVRVAELVAGHELHEYETHEDGHDQHPHQGVAVAAARHRHVDDVARAEPRQDDDDPRPKGAKIVGERPGNGGRLDRGHRRRLTSFREGV